MTQPLPLIRVLGSPVQVDGVSVGAVSDVYADQAGERVIGLEITDRSGGRRFLPWIAATIDSCTVRSASRFVLSGDLLGYYRRHGKRIARADVDSLWFAAGGSFV